MMERPLDLLCKLISLSIWLIIIHERLCLNETIDPNKLNWFLFIWCCSWCTNIGDGGRYWNRAFCKNSSFLKAVNYFHKMLPLRFFDMTLNTPLALNSPLNTPLLTVSTVILVFLNKPIRSDIDVCNSNQFIFILNFVQTLYFIRWCIPLSNIRVIKSKRKYIVSSYEVTFFNADNLQIQPFFYLFFISACTNGHLSSLNHFSILLLLCRNHSIDLLFKSMGWFLHNSDNMLKLL